MMETAAFKDAYLKIVTRAWSDEGYRESLLEDPAPALRAGGLELPDDAVVRLDEKDYSAYEEPTLDAAAAVWNEGYTSRVFRLDVPPPSAVDTAELDESELAGLSGGVCCSCCCG